MRANTLLTSVFAAAILLGVSAVSAHAQTASPNSSASPSAELRRIIRERIEQTVRDNETDGPRFIGVIGTITKVGTSTFTLRDVQGRDRTVQMTASVPLLLNGKPAAITDLVISSGVVVMGSAPDEVIINARRILAQDKDFTETRQVFVGSIQKWDGRMLELTQRGTEQTEAWTVNRQVVLEDSLGSKITTKDVQVDQSAVVITNEPTPGKIEVVRIRLLAPVERTP